MSSVAYGVRARIRKATNYLNIAAFFTVLMLGVRADAEPLNILAFGDSLTAGYGLAQGEGFVPVLQAALTELGADAQVTNGAVSGDTTAGGRARLDWILTEDIDAVILNLGANDMLRGTDPGETRKNLEAILATLAARDLPVQMLYVTASANFGTQYQTEFDQIFTELPSEKGLPPALDYFAGLRLLGDQQSVVVDLIQQDGLHPTAEGIKLIVDHLAPQIIKSLPFAR